MGHEDGIVGAEHDVTLARELPQPVPYRLRLRPEMRGEGGDVRRQSGVREAAIDGQTQVFEIEGHALPFRQWRWLDHLEAAYAGVHANRRDLSCALQVPGPILLPHDAEPSQV